MIKAKCAAMLILVFLAIAGCAVARGESVPPSSPSTSTHAPTPVPLLTTTKAPAAEASPIAEVIIGPEDNGKTVEVNIGDTLHVGLPSNPSTGYTWEVAEIDEKVLGQVGEVEFEPESDLLGAPGKQILYFKAVGMGQTPLKLIYRRPWEKGVEPAETFSIQVVVR